MRGPQKGASGTGSSASPHSVEPHHIMAIEALEQGIDLIGNELKSRAKHARS